MIFFSANTKQLLSMLRTHCIGKPVELGVERTISECAKAGIIEIINYPRQLNSTRQSSKTASQQNYQWHILSQCCSPQETFDLHAILAMIFLAQSS